MTQHTSTSMGPIPYGKQHITDEDIAEVVKVLRSDFLTQGPSVKSFEDQFSQYIGTDYSIAVANGTAALHLGALALGVDSRTNVLVTPITFAASANCIRYCGGKVDFVDVDPATALLDLNQVEDKLKKNPGKYQGIVAVDFAGRPVDLESLRKLADAHGAWIISDACHALGGYMNDRHGQQQMCGNSAFADISVFSFHPVKHLTTGEGGMITTRSQQLYDKMMMLRTHGITKDPALMHENHGGWYYEMQTLGFNYRLTDIQAALGISQLKRMPANVARRRVLAKRYDEALAALGLSKLTPGPEGHAYHLYVMRSSQRKALYDFLRTKQIFTQVHYIPVHLLPYYREQGFQPGMFPHAEKYYQECLSLPMYPTLTDDEQSYVIGSLASFASK